MSMDDTIDILTTGMDRAVNDEASFVDGSLGVVDDIAFQVDLDEIGSRDLLEKEAEAVEQEMSGLAGHARGNVCVDQIGPAEMIDQPVARRQIDALLPFCGIDVVLAHDLGRAVVSPAE